MADEEVTAQATAEAAEIQADIKEAKEEAAQARAAGDDDRAAKLETRIDALSTDLTEVKDVLKKLAERPFAPAPQPTQKVAETAPVEEEKPKERVHRFGSRRWFGDRAYE